MSPRIRGALTRAWARAAASPFAKPVARVLLAAAGLVLLAAIGRAGTAGAFGHGTSTSAAAWPVVLSAASSTASSTGAPTTAVLNGAGTGSSGVAAIPTLVFVADGPPVGGQAATANAVAAMASATPASPGEGAHAATRATPDDPVVLNTASAEDLRRLPGIGQKRAEAILALRAHLGRFRAIEDLMKVKGIGRAMLRRLRPLVRLDGPARTDAGPSAP